MFTSQSEHVTIIYVVYGANKYIDNNGTPMSAIFTGFSTVGSTQAKSFKMYDLELIKQDLLNHFNTRIGERVMRPEYGCRIWDYLMEQFTDYVKNAIQQEAIRICESDSRVSLQGSPDVQSTHNAIQVSITLLYVPLDVVDVFTVNFETRQTEQGY